MDNNDVFVNLNRKIEELLALDIPFVIYRRPNSKEVIFLIDDNRKIKESGEDGFIFAPFDSENHLEYFLSNKNKTVFTESIFLFDNKKFKEKNISPSSTTEKKHVKIVDKAIQSIQQKRLEKVVISRRQRVTSIKNTPLIYFRRILNKYPTAMVYFWYHPNTSIWLGASPEILLECSQYNFKTVSLAATKEFNDTMEVEWNQKEIEEQGVVTSYILEKLLSKGVVLDELEKDTVKAGPLLHLKTNISGTFPKNIKCIDLIQTLHPTPAICGIPKEKAFQFIKGNEGYDREYYTGYLGEYSATNDSNIFVNLRCMKLMGQIAYLYVGGGINKQSIGKDEFFETVTKSKVIGSVLEKL